MLMNSEKPKISLFSSAVRPELWMRFYESLSSNNISFEVIFVGNKPPQFKLPENCCFIYSEVKPAQCFEIGSRYAIGEYILPFADDCVFSESALDNLYNEFVELNDDKIILSCRYILDGKDRTGDSAYYWTDDKSSPVMPLSGLMKKKIWQQLGGVDSRFVALYWDLDIAMRLYEIGGKVIISDNAFIEEFQWNHFWERPPRIMENFSIKKKLHPFLRKEFSKILSFLRRTKTKPRLVQEYGETIDRPFLDQCWALNDKVLSKKRLKPFVPFDDKDILTISQGPRGKWK